MTYAVNDRSVSAGSPIECYEFTSPNQTWRYTSFNAPITVDGDLYTPLPITRNAIDIGSVVDTLVTMDFNIPCNDSLAKAYCYAKTPKDLTVTVKRVHEGDDYSTEFSVEYVGTIAGSSASGKYATIKTSSLLQTKLNGNLSSVYYQRSCNHTLFDERCKAIRATYTESAIVTKIQDQLITVDDMVHSADELIGGEMTNVRTGEKQVIVTNSANLIRVGYLFTDIVLGDTVELTLGCDHSRLGDCKTRFNNTDNYGGMDFIPSAEFFPKLQYTLTVNTTETIKETAKNVSGYQPLPIVTVTQG